MSSAATLRVATASEDGLAKLWKIHLEEKDTVPELISTLTDSSSRDHASWRGHSAGIQSIKYCPASGGDRGFDSDDDHGSPFQEEALLTGSKDKSIIMWKKCNLPGKEIWEAEVAIPKPREKFTLEELHDKRLREHNMINSAADRMGGITDKQQIAMAQQGISKGEKERLDPHVGHTDYVNMATLASEGRGKGEWVLSCSDDKTAMIWEIKRSELNKPIPPKLNKLSVLQPTAQDARGHTLPVVMAEWNLECNKVLTCSYDKTCIIWEPVSGRILKMLPLANAQPQDRHQGPIWSAYWSPDGSQVLTASKDRTARIWDVNKGQCVRCFPHDDLVLHAVYSPRNDQVLTSSLDGAARLWDYRQAQSTGEVKGGDSKEKTLGGPNGHHTAHTSAVWHASFANKDQQPNILTCSHDMTALIWDQKRFTKDAAANEPKSTLAGHTGILWQATFSQDDQYVVTCSEDRTARLWDVRTGIPHPPCWVLGSRNTKHSQAVTCATYMGGGGENQ